MKRSFVMSLAALGAVAAFVNPLGADAAQPAPTTSYDSSYATLPGNVASVGYEATGTKELGDEITLAPGTGRKLATVRVAMSSWACQSGTWNNKDCFTSAGAKGAVPITLNVYAASSANADGTVTPGKLLTRVTKSFAVPYRPTASLSKCNSTNNSTGKWYSSADGKCYNGKAFNITYDFSSLGINIPDTVVLGVSYDTTHTGYSPIGEQEACFGTSGGCIYDALNVGVDGTGPSVGTKPHPNTVFQNTSQAGNLCDATPAVDVFNLDSPTTACWGGLNPDIKVTTRP